MRNRIRSRVSVGYFALMLAAGFASALASGCVALPRRPGVPPELTTRAVTPGAKDSRYWPDIDPRPMFRDSLLSVDRERRLLDESDDRDAHLPPADILALSGGGDAGAFGAGLLVGWADEGSRPQFKMVTGISAGALIAPFAFLGREYDTVLRDVCSSIGPRDIYQSHNILTALVGDGFADDRPLEALIAKYVTAQTLADISREYAKGRLLLIGTTDLDARQRVVWNMGAIASSPDPRALKLFRQVILASTAIPGIFPPVMIDVEVNGEHFQEMHVDGGVMNRVFLLPPLFVSGIEAERDGARRSRHVYVVLNGYMSGKWLAVSRRTAAVARRALDAMIEVQGVNDIYRLEVAAQQDRAEFAFASIGADFIYPHKAEFDAEYMQHLFRYAYQLAARGYEWRFQSPTMTQSQVEKNIVTAPATAPPEWPLLLSLPYEDIAAATEHAADPIASNAGIHR